MDDILVINKPRFLTPLQTMELARKRFSIPSSVKMTYAGRLDPLASGVMIVLCGKEIENKPAFLSLNKTYKFVLLLGLESDSHDLLGIPRLGRLGKNRTLFQMRVRDAMKDMVGHIRQEYPVFSGKTVGGKKLFDWYKEGKFDEVERPTLTGTLFSLHDVSWHQVSLSGVIDEALLTCETVQGDFRQKEIANAWVGLRRYGRRQLWAVKSQMQCTSGLYVRKVCDDIGKRLGCEGLAYRIFRVGVGGYGLADCVGIDDNTIHEP